jgi:hypothetical protein
MKILSIDPAIKTLAVSKFDISNNKITNLEMNLINLVGNNKVSSFKFEEIVDSLFEAIEKINIDNVDVVLIENIPSYKNPKIKSVSVCLYSYYVLQGLNVVFCSPNSKNAEIKACKTYAERKKKSVELCTELLKDTDDFIKFNSYKKKDDIADSILQGVFYANNKK